MKRFMIVSAASALVFAASAGVSPAAGLFGPPAVPSFDRSVSPLQSAAFAKNGNSDRVDRMVHRWKGGEFAVKRIDQIYSNGEVAALKAHAGESKRVTALQSAIEDNRMLSGSLEAENVDIHNVVDANKAMDGTMIFYIR
jgi:hypothetical protein